MNPITIFAIRAVTGGLFAFILMRVFRPDLHPVYFLPMAAFLIGTAYALDYLRKRKSTEKGKPTH